MSASQPDKKGWVSLSAYNTMAVPVLAKKLVKATNVDEIKVAIKYAKESEQRFLILGEGSNTVFVQDFPGTVIVVGSRGITRTEQTDSKVSVKVAAGENWHAFVSHCMVNQWYGLENLALIPGLVGAAPIQNIGAYGVEVGDLIKSVDVLDVNTLGLETLSQKDCEFSYRESRFKRDWINTKVVTAVTFELSMSPEVTLTYPALKAFIEQGNRLSDNDSVQPHHVFDAVIAIRNQKLPNPKDLPNAGSFFKNPVVNNDQHADLKGRFPQLVSYPQTNGYKLAAAWLIEQRGWKRRELNGVRVHESQALVIINPSRVHGSKVKELALAIQYDIRRSFGVDLEIEPILI